ncbi:MAG: type II toxin-antitoxin system HipA family toxin [Rhodobacteraceae bacterium]|nr:type II toxin-antitoxin system HipA family toxin [Paracoccaceae bacterium]
MIRRLNIELDFGDRRLAVGQVAWVSDQRRAAVEWTQEFLADPLPVSPYAIRSWNGLHFGEYTPFDGLPGVLADSLPDGWGRLLIDRELARRRRAFQELTPVDRLAIVGRHGMGALSYHPEEEQTKRADVDLDWFAGSVQQIEKDIPLEDLRRLRAGSGGSAGVRPKFVALLNVETGVLRDHRVGAGQGFSHHLIKFRTSSDPESAVCEEQAFSEMARAAGINMSDTKLFTTRSGEDLFATRRFDRPAGRRLHMHTVAGILNADFSASVVDYETLLKLTNFMTNHQGDVEEMFRRMVFNVLAHNRDDHIKNHAFLMDHRGTWRLSPAYDLSFSDGPGGEHHLSINGNGRNPSMQDLTTAGQGAGLKQRSIAGIIEHVRQAVSQWPVFADACGVPAKRRKEIAARLISVERDWQ